MYIDPFVSKQTMAIFDDYYSFKDFREHFGAMINKLEIILSINGFVLTNMMAEFVQRSSPVGGISFTICMEFNHDLFVNCQLSMFGI